MTDLIIFFEGYFKTISWVNISLFGTVYKAPQPGAPVPPGHEHRVQCNYGKPAPPGKSCNVDVLDFKPCISSERYQYDAAKPCIFLKLNKVLYNSSYFFWFRSRVS